MKIQLLVFVINLVVKGYSFEEYSNEWLIEITTTDDEESKRIFEKHGFRYISKIEDGLYVVRHESSPLNSRRRADVVRKRLLTEDSVRKAEQQVWNKRVLKSITINDAQWKDMWYINGNTNPDMGVQKAWDKGYTGKDINIAIVDDGVEIEHPDLKPNFKQRLSRDVYDRDADPSPGPGAEHGTQCAGVTLAAKNTICNVGVAFNGNLGAVRMIGPSGSTNTMEHDALLIPDIDIFSNSWGTQEKTTMEEPDDLVKNAILKGVQQGRKGLGSIYVWAAGNGGDDDNCNCDGFVNSIYTIGISSVSIKHEPPAYAEPCSAIMATAFSGGGGSSDICTTYPGKTCVTSFSGTSAATPMAAGILALALEANSSLTWRDIQHLIVNTSDLSSLQYGNTQTNGAGIQVSDYFGFGLLQADRLIETAKVWKTVRTQQSCSLPTKKENRIINKGVSVRVVNGSQVTDACNDTKSEVKFLEHVQVTITYKYSQRGTVMFNLISPSDTKSKLLTRRNLDTKTDGTQVWTFMSVHFWDEDPIGTWTLQMSLERDYQQIGELVDWSLTLHGTTDHDIVTDKPKPGNDVQKTGNKTRNENGTDTGTVCDSDCMTIIAVVAGTIVGAVLIGGVFCIIYNRRKCRKQQNISKNVVGPQGNHAQSNEINNAGQEGSTAKTSQSPTTILQPA